MEFSRQKVPSPLGRQKLGTAGSRGNSPRDSRRPSPFSPVSEAVLATAAAPAGRDPRQAETPGSFLLLEA